MNATQIHQGVMNLLEPACGIAGIAIVERFIQMLRDQFKLPSYFAPIFAIFAGVIAEVFLAWEFQYAIQDGVIIGLITGYLATLHHEITK